MTEASITIEPFVAVFPLVKYAIRFATAISEPGWYAANVTRKGRTVTWVPTSAALDEGLRQYFLDMLETVGYYGSTSNRKATLNGTPAPVSY